MTRELPNDAVGDALRDGDLAELFAQPQTFGDAPQFEAKGVRGLSLRLWMRHWLVVLAGLGYLQLPVPEVPRVEGWPVPTGHEPEPTDESEEVAA